MEKSSKFFSRKSLTVPKTIAQYRKHPIPYLNTLPNTLVSNQTIVGSQSESSTKKLRQPIKTEHEKKLRQPIRIQHEKNFVSHSKVSIMSPESSKLSITSPGSSKLSITSPKSSRLWWKSENLKIFSKLHSKTTSGVYMNLWLKSEVSFEIFGRIFSGNILSIILDRSMISNFQISRSAERSLSSWQDHRQLRGWDLSDLFRFLFGSLIWIVVDFPGELRCVLWDIPWTIYRHILSSISDRSLISKSSEFMIRFVISERLSQFCWEQTSRRSVLTLLGHTICRVDIFPCEIRGLVFRPQLLSVDRHILSEILDRSMISNSQNSWSTQRPLRSFQDFWSVLRQIFWWYVVRFVWFNDLDSGWFNRWNQKRHSRNSSDTSSSWSSHDLRHTNNLEFFRIHDQINDVEGPLKILFRSEISKITSKIYSDTKAGEWSILRVKSEVWKLRQKLLSDNWLP